MAFDHDVSERTDSAWMESWAVTRCEHGCVHIHLDRTCITLTPVEFERLTMMLTKAATTFATESRSEIHTRAH